MNRAGVVEGLGERWREGIVAFTCVSEKGCSVVDYCIVGCEYLDVIKNFTVTTMSESMVEMECKGAVSRVPDHSLLRWQVAVDGVDEVKEECKSGKERKLRAPEGYLEGEVERLAKLMDRVMNAGRDQVTIGKVYEELVAVMKASLEVKVKEGRRGQPWFTKEIAGLRKAWHRAEKEWLSCGDKEAKREKRRVYVEKRKRYIRAVRRTKNRFEESRQVNLEKLVRSPKKW